MDDGKKYVDWRMGEDLGTRWEIMFSFEGLTLHKIYIENEIRRKYSEKAQQNKQDTIRLE